MSTLVVIPTYDEAGVIETTLDRVLAAQPDAHVLVVDDASPDGTADLVEARADFGRRVFVLHRPGKGGLGAAYRAGFGWALHRGYTIVVQMDADLSHPPERIPALVAALAGGADLAVGSRYVRGGAIADWSWSRRVVSWVGNRYVRLVLRLPVRDATAGFKAFRASALGACGTTSSQADGYCFQIENTWRAARAGLVVTEVPIVFTDRQVGTSKMSSQIVVEAVLRVLGWRYAELRESGPVDNRIGGGRRRRRLRGWTIPNAPR